MGKIPFTWIWQKIVHFQRNSRVPDNSWKIPGMMEFLNSTLKIKFYAKNWVKKISYTPNLPKLVHFQRSSRGPDNSWEIPGMMKFWNSRLKFKFFDIKWVRFIPYMLKSVKTSQFQGTSGILESWIPGSRNHDLSQNLRKINTNMLRRLVL